MGHTQTGGNSMRHRILLAVLLCMTLLSGCTGRKVDLSKETESTIGVNGDGSVEEVVIEPFDKDYYSLTELTAYVNKQVDAFNQANPQEQPENKKADDEEITAVTVRYVETDADAKTAKMALGYLNMDIYNSFNETDFQFLSMEEAASDKSIADMNGLVEVKSGEEKSFSDVSEHKHLHLIYTDSSVRIQTGGKIMYYSKDASLTDDYTIQTADGPSVILFK